VNETRDRQVRVTFKRAVSDGNYGTESVEVTLEDWIFGEHTQAGDDSLVAQTLLARARRLAYGQLAESNNQRVRQAVTTVMVATPDDDDDGPPF